MNRVRFGKLAYDVLTGAAILSWFLTAFFVAPHLPDWTVFLWVPLLVGILHFSFRPLKILEFWIAGHPDPRESLRQYEIECAIRAQDDTSFGG